MTVRLPRTETGLGAALVAGLLVAGVAPAQTTQVLETGDGSRFLLVPLATRVVHWMNLHAADVSRPDLTLAVTRASLVGATGGVTVDVDPLAFEKALRRAPSSGSRIIELPGHVGISVTFPPESIRTVAELLNARLHRTSLIRVREHLSRIRTERAHRLGRMTHLGMLRRLLAKSPEGRAAQPLLYVKDDRIPIPKVLEFYRQTFRPKAAIHVLTGGFDVATATRVLREVFVARGEAPEASEAPVDLGGHRIRVAPDRGDTMLVGCPLPEAPFDHIDLMVEYLAGHSNAFLAESLRAAGHASVTVHAEGPFPVPGGILMIQISTIGRRIKPESELLSDVQKALDAAMTTPPEARRLNRAKAALRAHRTAQLNDAEGLTRMLAMRWVRSGRPPADILRGESISAATLQALCRQTLGKSTRSVILPEPPR